MRHPNQDAKIVDLHKQTPVSVGITTIDSSYGKRSVLQIERNMSQNSMSLSSEILDSKDPKRTLNRERHDVLTISHFTIEKDGADVQVIEKSQEEQIYYQNHECLKKAHKKGLDSIFHRFGDF